MANNAQLFLARSKGTRLLMHQGTISGVRMQILELAPSVLAEPVFDQTHKSYPRTKVGGSRGMERLVIINYAQLIDKVREVIREKLENGDIGLGYNTIRDLRNACLELDGLRPSDFTKKDGASLERNRAFGEMVKQFFLDEHLIRQIFKEAKLELLEVLATA